MVRHHHPVEARRLAGGIGGGWGGGLGDGFVLNGFRHRHVSFLR
jgi:hypothetical protein